MTRSPPSTRTPIAFWVDFEKAARCRFDLVVGADGLHSVTRRLAFGTEARALYPLGILNAWFTIPAEIELDDWYLMYNSMVAAGS
jgi:2-polyprenyl-6-methoxyphenol hydroxylase-like FAD-dependent oxidoreductase